MQPCCPKAVVTDEGIYAMETKKTYQIVEVVLILLAMLFTAVGCERKMGNLPEKTTPTESAEQTQSLNEAALASAEAEELGV